MSNVKQLGLAMLAYAQDYDELLPPAYIVVPKAVYPNGTTGGSYLWHHLLQPYIKNAQVFNCPTAPSSSWYAGGFGDVIPYGATNEVMGTALGGMTYPA